MTAGRRHVGLSRTLAIAALVIVAAAALFGAVAADVFSAGRLAHEDARLAQWLHAHATPTLTATLLVVTHVHSTFAIACYGALAALLLARSRHRREAAAVVVSIAGVLALNAGLKLAFARARPVFDDPLLTLGTYSFPSGHVAATTVFYGLLVAWSFARTRRPGLRALAAVAAPAAVVLVAFSRMYLGVHYLSDTVAAGAEGVAWLAICLGALAVSRQRAGIAP
ncbi:MAG: phosphatase PAP2 family protein [Caldimonas sp.]